MHLRSFRFFTLLFAAGVVCATVAYAQNRDTTICACQIPDGPPNAHPYLVGYLGVYKNADWNAVARTLDFTKMTHLNLAFVNPPICSGPCTAQSDMTLAANRSLTDEALKTIVDAAHAHGTKVLISIGGDGGDKNIMQFYNAGLSSPLTDVIDAYLKKHDIDGVDVDIEQPTQMGVPFTTFVSTLVARLRPKGKLVTAAVAQYIQAGTQDDVLPQFDIVNVMIYGSYERSVTDMAWWANTKHVPREKLTLGIGFHNYSAILASYPNAWAVDTVGGGTYRDGAVFSYQGETTVARETQLGAQYGGAMIWELTQDDPASPHSLLKVIQKNLDPAVPRIPQPTPRRGGGD
ncbi:MAG TPA: glycosyl hydrolase family 18 protein [Vicinamibacterales bacterium]